MKGIPAHVSESEQQLGRTPSVHAIGTVTSSLAASSNHRRPSWPATQATDSDVACPAPPSEYVCEIQFDTPETCRYFTIFKILSRKSSSQRILGSHSSFLSESTSLSCFTIGYRPFSPKSLPHVPSTFIFFLLSCSQRRLLSRQFQVENSILSHQSTVSYFPENVIIITLEDAS